MRRILTRTAVVVGVVVGSAVVVLVLLVVFGRGSLRLPVTHTDAFDADGIGVPALVTDGTRVLTTDGDPVVLRGVMIPDPSVLHADGQFERGLATEIADAGANVIRIPVHPGYWTSDSDYLWRYLDPMVRWAGEEGMYAILDLHSIGNVLTGRAPHSQELYSHTERMARDFWTDVAGHFAGAPNVLFEVFNEPEGISAQDWWGAATDLIAVIREQGATQPVIVGGLDYGRDLSWVLETPIDDGEVIYASHIYPVHPEARWDAWFGDVARQYPVLVTEWGFMDENRTSAETYLAGDSAGYGTPLLSRLDGLGVGWVACWWDEEWRPAMFTDDEALETTRWGQFVLDALAADGRAERLARSAAEAG